MALLLAIVPVWLLPYDLNNANDFVVLSFLFGVVMLAIVSFRT